MSEICNLLGFWWQFLSVVLAIVELTMYVARLALSSDLSLPLLLSTEIEGRHHLLAEKFLLAVTFTRSCP